jgi:hypothetical protein
VADDAHQFNIKVTLLSEAYFISSSVSKDNHHTIAVAPILSCKGHQYYQHPNAMQQC